MVTTVNAKLRFVESFLPVNQQNRVVQQSETAYEEVFNTWQPHVLAGAEAADGLLQYKPGRAVAEPDQQGHRGDGRGAGRVHHLELHGRE